MAHAEGSPAAGGGAMSPRRRSLAGSLEAWLGALVEIPAALLVVAEIVILFAGVVARYGLHRPLIWSDELASILFLWLAMLGATIALRHNSHMRLTLFVNRATENTRAWLESAGTVIAGSFMALILVPAFEYAADERFITTPALGIPNSWRTMAIA